MLYFIVQNTLHFSVLVINMQCMYISEADEACELNEHQVLHRLSIFYFFFPFHRIISLKISRSALYFRRVFDGRESIHIYFG